jgi:predicted MFS family arabinose efflux permease
MKWRAILICFVTQNVAMGVVFGTFGPLLKANEDHFGVSRGTAALGMSLILLGLGLSSPLIGRFTSRYSLRFMMFVGAILISLSYFVIAVINIFSIALVFYSLIGVGVCVLAVIGPISVVSNWCDTDKGKMLAVVNLPLLLFLSPYVVSQLIPEYGRTSINLAIGGIFVLLLPVIAFLVERPEELAPYESQDDNSQALLGTEILSSGAIVSKRQFWLLSLGVGTFSAAATAFSVHIIPFGMESGMSFEKAAMLLSVYAAAGVLGSFMFGYIIDWLSSSSALIMSAVCQAAAILGLLHLQNDWLFLCAVIFGACVVPQLTLLGAALADVFGSKNAGQAMGLCYPVKLPFLFAAAPLVGYLYEAQGNYEASFYMLTAILVVAAGLFAYLLVIERLRSAATVPTV